MRADERFSETFLRDSFWKDNCRGSHVFVDLQSLSLVDMPARPVVLSHVAFPRSVSSATTSALDSSASAIVDKR